MKKLIIDHFSLRSNELKVLKVLEIVYVFCTVALFLVMVNQCGETLTEGSVSVSDVVSITAEGLILFCEVAFLAILQRGLNGVGHQKSLVRCANVLTTVMGLGVVYAILANFRCFIMAPKTFPTYSIGRRFFPICSTLCLRSVCLRGFISTLPASCAPIFAMRYLRHC